MTIQHLVVSLHVVAAVFVLGPLMFAISATPRAIRSGGAATLRFLVATTRVYAYGSIIVLLLGLGAVRSKYHMSYGQTWVWVSIVLFVVAFGLITGVVLPAQRRALRLLDEGASATDQLPAIGAGAGIASVLIAVIVFLMIYQPGR
ncbi:MAG TPA: DUF2269 family protein [Mycobacteriales bacterium]